MTTKAVRAFTLVEMMVALAVAMLLCGVMISLFANSSNIWTRENERSDSFREARAALDYMARDLGKLRPLADIQQTIPLLALQAHPDTLGPDQVNQEVYALVAANNPGYSDWCAVGYYCAWSEKHSAWVLRRQIRESNGTFSRLAKVLSLSAPQTPQTAFQTLFDRSDLSTTPTGNAKDSPGEIDDLATYVWDLRFTIPEGTPINASQQTIWPQGCFSEKLPAWVEIRFKALSALSARRLPRNFTREDWKNTTSDLYKNLVAPNTQEFVTRVQFSL